MPALLKAVRDLVHSDLAEFVWVDAGGEVANLYAEQIPPELASEILDDSQAISAATTWKDRATRAESIMLRLHDELGDENARALQRAADQVGR